jgi:hypothetical protein
MGDECEAMQLVMTHDSGLITQLMTERLEAQCSNIS